MSTERPDNDATPDATGGTRGASEAEGPVSPESPPGTEGAGQVDDASEAGGAGQVDDASEAGGAGQVDDASEAGDADSGGTESADASEGGEASEGAGSTESSESAQGLRSPEGTESAKGLGSPEGADGGLRADDGVRPDSDVISDGEVGPERDVSPEGGVESRPHRRRSSLVAAAVAAAVLLVGGGGAYLATSTTGASGGGSDSGAPAGDGTPPPLTLDGYTEEGTNGIAPGEPNPGGVTYRSDGDLPDGPDSAPVYRSAGDVTSAEVARLAKALGIEGRPTAEDGMWRVGGAPDGSGPRLQVHKDAPGTWTFSRYAPGTDNCRKADVCASGTIPVGDPVSEAVAKQAAAPVLKAVGQDAAKLDATQVAGAVRTVNADPEVGGLPTYGWTTGIQVGTDGQVVGGSGNVKAPAKGDTYPVIGAEKALDLMNGTGAGAETGAGNGTGDGRKGIGGCADPVPLKDRNEAPCEVPTEAPSPEPVVVEGAVFGLASHFVDGEQALVPSWLFEVRPEGADGSFTVTHPAVDPTYLTAPTPSETGQPADPPSSAPETRGVTIEGYTVKDDKLTVSFWGGVCSEYSASADERNGEVTVTVTEKSSGKVCILIAKAMERTVDLDKPLGDREVVDARGKKIPKGSLTDRLPDEDQPAR